MFGSVLHIWIARVLGMQYPLDSYFWDQVVNFKLTQINLTFSRSYPDKLSYIQTFGSNGKIEDYFPELLKTFPFPALQSTGVYNGQS